MIVQTTVDQNTSQHFWQQLSIAVTEGQCKVNTGVLTLYGQASGEF